MRLGFTAIVVVMAGVEGQESQRSTCPLVRRYLEGETTTYHMTASNQDVHRDLRYEADVTCTVKKNADGVFVEDCEWANLVVNKKAVELPSGAGAVHQVLSRDPAFKLGVPDLSKVPPALIGPITDLLTFYVDLQLAVRGEKLAKAGDHFRFEYGAPASWADGSMVSVGEDSLDFDVTLSAIDARGGTATTVVKHVPPEKPQIRKVADWTAVPVADTANNWIQVVKIDTDSYLGQVGKETFDVQLVTRLSDGRLASATLDNVVEVLERPSRKPDLSNPGAESRYKIVRRIALRETGASPATGK